MSKSQSTFLICLGVSGLFACNVSNAQSASIGDNDQLVPKSQLNFAIGVPKELFKVLSTEILNDKGLKQTCDPVLKNIDNDKYKAKFVPAPFKKGQSTREMLAKYSVISIECRAEAHADIFSSLGRIIIGLGTQMPDAPIVMYANYVLSGCAAGQCCMRSCYGSYRKSKTACGPLC
jgi:hypothetical protein